MTETTPERLTLGEIAVRYPHLAERRKAVSNAGFRGRLNRSRDASGTTLYHVDETFELWQAQFLPVGDRRPAPAVQPRTRSQVPGPVEEATAALSAVREAHIAYVASLYQAPHEAPAALDELRERVREAHATIRRLEDLLEPAEMTIGVDVSSILAGPRSLRLATDEIG